MTRNTSIVPALMFHSVGLENHAWAWSGISEPVELFEAKIALLKKSGFTGVFWSDVYEHMSGSRKLPDNSILLTFDDGYLDNWVYVYPILKKYDMKATIFVNPEFVDPGGVARPTSDNGASGPAAGFLNWLEMREMEKSGLIDIQSHALTHTWYFSGAHIVDYHRPHEVTPYPWLFWNSRLERKPYYLTENQQDFLPWGYPILEHSKSLVATRFFPDDSAVTAITDFVSAAGGAEFFQDSAWQQSLNNFVSKTFDGGKVPGSFENEDARVERIREELRKSKAIIESNLDKKVDFICWPGGANDKTVQQMALDVGYKSWTLDSRSKLQKRNMPGQDPSSIKRMGTSNQIMVKGRYCGTGGAKYFLLKVLAHQGSQMHAAAVKFHKLLALTRSVGGTA